MSSKRSRPISTQILLPAENNCIYILALEGQLQYDCWDRLRTSTAPPLKSTSVTEEYRSTDTLSIPVNHSKKFNVPLRMCLGVPLWYEAFRWLLFASLLTVLCLVRRPRKARGIHTNKVNCPLQEISNGRRIGGGPPPYSLRSFIEFECHNGYTMIGPAKIICEVNGWSSASPVCKKIDPPAPRPTTTTTTSPSITKTTTTSTTTAARGGVSCTGSLCIGVFKAFVERVLVALLIPLSLHLSL
ncbi:hypothetical protein JZ751_014788 [Albula glossodonta]|uniref:Sushi domain-containing protein n=1 Tax=Albula glossodonta TaxID=121402 RepID=A0A8T2MZR1_9TELE|nr:hypothetical protein JZ751_014788 [Albula glossodonta]